MLRDGRATTYGQFLLPEFRVLDLAREGALGLVVRVECAAASVGPRQARLLQRLLQLVQL